MTDDIDDGRELSDEALVARAAAGAGPRHLEQLLDRYRAPIFRRCLAVIGHPDDAEDITQEVLLRVFRGLDGYQGRSSFRTWLYAIVRNECWTYAARRERQTIPDEIRMKIALHFDRESYIRTRPVSRRQLHRMFSRMPPRAREIVQLRYLREMPLPNIAGLLGMSLSATKMNLYRALALGRQVMDVAVARSRNVQSMSSERLVDRMGPTH